MARDLRISLTRLKELNNVTGFDEGLIEKALRLEDLLKEIFQHPYLSKRLLLKGGTALNFCYFDKPRLSVDIDFNYVGSIDRETMKQERPILENAIVRIVKDREYDLVHRPGDEHAGGKWRLLYRNVRGENQNLEFDINYLYRVPIGLVQNKTFKAFDVSEGFKIRIVSKEELFAGKVVASLSRVMARDVYDVSNIAGYSGIYDKLLFRKAVILLGTSQREDFRKISSNRLSKVSEKDIKDTLYPLIPLNKRVSRKGILDKAISFVADLLRFTSEEKEFLDRYLNNAEYRPDILFRQYPHLILHIERHPALLWKRINIERYLKNKTKKE